MHRVALNVPTSQSNTDVNSQTSCCLQQAIEFSRLPSHNEQLPREPVALLRSCDLAAPAARPSAVALGRVRKPAPSDCTRRLFAQNGSAAGNERFRRSRAGGKDTALHAAQRPGSDGSTAFHFSSRCVLPHAKHVSYSSPSPRRDALNSFFTEREIGIL